MEATWEKASCRRDDDDGRRYDDGQHDDHETQHPWRYPYLQGADAIDVRNARGMTPLHLAMSVGNAGMAQALLEAGAGAPK